MKVALVHHSFARKGGLERYLLDLAAAFRQAGDQVEAWARDVDPACVAEAGIPVHRLRVPGWPRAWKSRLLARAVQRQRLTQRFDLSLSCTRTLGQDLYACGGTHAGFLAKSGRRPTGFDRAEIAAERATIANSRYVVAHSGQVAHELEEHYSMPAAKLRRLYPPVDASRFRYAGAQERQQARRELGLEEGKPVFLFAASGDLVNKGLALVLEAFAALPRGSATLLLTGSASDAAADTPGLRRLGPRADMPPVYAAANWTLLPSRYEAFGLVAAESLQCGTPVITTAQAGIAEILKVGEDGWVLSRQDRDELVAALRQAVTAPLHPQADFVGRKGLHPHQHVAALKALVRGA